MIQGIAVLLTTLLLGFVSIDARAADNLSQISLDAATTKDLADGFYETPELTSTVSIHSKLWILDILNKTYSYKIGKYNDTQCNQSKGFSSFVNVATPLKAKLSSFAVGERLRLCLVGRLGPKILPFLYTESKAEFNWTMKIANSSSFLAINPTSIDFHTVAVNESSVQALLSL